jgi:hypothetical protein
VGEATGESAGDRRAQVAWQLIRSIDSAVGVGEQIRASSRKSEKYWQRAARPGLKFAQRRRWGGGGVRSGGDLEMTLCDRRICQTEKVYH